ncbi:MAG: chorismate mutase, partial [Bacteroidales bacterium]|nr:chorismate mutase [Bacteroidales bacterium]
NIAILQTSRWDVVLSKVIEKGKEYGLGEEFLKTVFNAVHEASVQVQDSVLSDNVSAG